MVLFALATALSAVAGNGISTGAPGAAKAAQLQAFYVRHEAGRGNQTEQSIRNLGGRVDYRFPNINSVAVSLPEAAVTRLATMDHVVFHEAVPEHRTMAQVIPWNIDQFQARDVWDSNRDGLVDAGAPDGSGVKFCIIDTGFYGPHDDFQGINASGESQISGEMWNEDGAGHGTHVAGTANAVNNNIGVVGVMPGGAELYIIKIFGNDGLWQAGQSNLGNAATACRDAGANVISMSLGGGYSATEDAIFQDLYDNSNIVNIAAAGNDGNGSTSYPASYDSVVSVAALEESEAVAGFSQYPATNYDPANPPANVEWDTVELSGGGAQVLSTWPSPDANVPVYQVTAGGISYAGNQIAETGLATVTGTLVSGGLCDSIGSWTGNLVLCERGDVSFADKVNNVNAGGGLGAVIFNNISGNFAGTCAGGCTSSIPAISISQADGQALANQLGSSAELVADDGTGCVSCSGGYNIISGTSMATPGVAAGLSFVWDACGGPTGITNKQLRQLLRDSARDLSGTHPATGSGGTSFAYGAGPDVATGWGLVQLADALELGNQRFGSTCPLGLSVDPVSIDVCALNDDSTSIAVTLDDSFLGSATLSVSGLPGATSGLFSPNPLVHPLKQSSLTVDNLSMAAGGSYSLVLTATDDGDPSNTAAGAVTLNLFAGLPAAPVLVAPANGSIGLDTLPTLSWNPASDAADYRVEIANDPAFSNVVYSATVAATTHTVATPLATGTSYYWRVTAGNLCGDGETSAAASFQTIQVQCQAPGLAIPDNSAIGISDTISFSGSASITDIDVSIQISHSWVGDLAINLTHADTGTEIVLVDRPGFAGSGAGCRHDDVDVTIDDEGTSPVEDACDSTPPAIAGSLTPIQALSGFDTELLAGDWTLNVMDLNNTDTGSLDSWCLIPAVMAGSNTAPVAANNSFGTDEDTTLSEDVSNNDFDADNDTLGYAVLSTTTNGMLSLAGDGSFNYTPASHFFGSDQFSYQVTDGNGGVSSALVDITVNPVNDEPQGTGDSFVVLSDTTLVVSAPGVLGNDLDVEMASLSAVLDTDVTNGSLTLNGDGSFEYLPNPGFTGNDSFSYHVNDGELDSATVTVSIQIVTDDMFGDGFED
jgi:subtilisin family serine protease/subtilisin-like proprotein convertase family protein